MALSDSLPQINLGVQGGTQGVFSQVRGANDVEGSQAPSLDKMFILSLPSTSTYEVNPMRRGESNSHSPV
ncbi:hypothetical protein TNCV_305621 [Trichonephila clavipes]|nr:hypothetical protein TNCV_305621 [Trichonephila clavipes]